jgi:hypothetical protein
LPQFAVAAVESVGYGGDLLTFRRIAAKMTGGLSSPGHPTSRPSGRAESAASWIGRHCRAPFGIRVSGKVLRDLIAQSQTICTPPHSRAVDHSVRTESAITQLTSRNGCHSLRAAWLRRACTSTLMREKPVGGGSGSCRTRMALACGIWCARHLQRGWACCLGMGMRGRGRVLIVSGGVGGLSAGDSRTRTDHRDGATRLHHGRDVVGNESVAG